MSKVKSVKSEKCQKWKVSKLKSVKSEKKQKIKKWKVSKVKKTVQSKKCQNYTNYFEKLNYSEEQTILKTKANAKHFWQWYFGKANYSEKQTILKRQTFLKIKLFGKAKLFEKKMLENVDDICAILSTGGRRWSYQNLFVSKFYISQVLEPNAIGESCNS
jgi:hypothetical protein